MGHGVGRFGGENWQGANVINVNIDWEIRRRELAGSKCSQRKY